MLWLKLSANVDFHLPHEKCTECAILTPTFPPGEKTRYWRWNHSHGYRLPSQPLVCNSTCTRSTWTLFAKSRNTHPSHPLLLLWLTLKQYKLILFKILPLTGRHWTVWPIIIILTFASRETESQQYQETMKIIFKYYVKITMSHALYSQLPLLNKWQRANTLCQQ